MELLMRAGDEGEVKDVIILDFTKAFDKVPQKSLPA
jgi:hypothetical protein